MPNWVRLPSGGAINLDRIVHVIEREPRYHPDGTHVESLQLVPAGTANTITLYGEDRVLLLQALEVVAWPRRE